MSPSTKSHPCIRGVVVHTVLALERLEFVNLASISLSSETFRPNTFIHFFSWFSTLSLGCCD